MSNKGFTLVELLAVIVILAVILSIAIPGISGIVKSVTRNAFASDAKMVLKAINYKMMEDDTFDPNTVNETNIKNLLNVGDDNYQSLTVKKINDELYVTIVGKNKWDKLTVSGIKSIIKVGDSITSFSNGANKPALVTGMTPIKWNDTDWIDTTESDTDWYNYNTTDKKWANARTADGSMWVWIPRYIYKISSGWHTNTAGTVDIQFTKGVDDNWNRAIIGNINLDETANASNNTWTNHPAFTFGDTELTGIWIAKFEASAPTDNICYTTPNTTNCNVDTITPNFIPNVSAMRYSNISNQFIISRNMEKDNTYGWGTSGNNIDTHMMKNVEWGAAAYLTQSAYGKNSEIWINNSSTYTTGCAGNSVSEAQFVGCQNAYNTANGLNASTTGNIYGIYDMSGGAWEHVLAYVDNGHSNLLAYGNNVIEANNKYKDVYTTVADDKAINYNNALDKKGGSVYDTSSSYSGSSSWNSDCSSMTYSEYPWFARGSYYGGSAETGIFSFSGARGNPHVNLGFRGVLAVGAGL